MNVVRHGGAIYGYTCGWSRRISVSVETVIGLAMSHDDGLTFHRSVTGRCWPHRCTNPSLVGDAFVQVIGDQFHMWYIFGTAWKRPAEGAAPDRTYKIGHAVSGDGVDWEKEEARQIIADRLDADESQALPTVARIGDRYHMIFCYRRVDRFQDEQGPRIPARPCLVGRPAALDTGRRRRRDRRVGRRLGLGHAVLPNLFECDGNTYLLYNGNEFGRHGFGLAVLE